VHEARAPEERPVTPARSHSLRLRRIGIDTYQEPVVYMRRDCHVCRAEGFQAQTRVQLRFDGRAIVATLNVVGDELLAEGEAGLSEAAWRQLGAVEGASVILAHAQPVESVGHVRAKIYGRRLEEAAFHEIVRDVVTGRYSDVQLASFVTACADERFDEREVLGLTRAMIAVGDRIDWGRRPVVDKHCVGGLPGNRTTLILVPIVAAAGLAIPKTSSRAITSPSGTADAMETLAPIALDARAMRRVVEQEGGCIAWGGAMRLSPADDVLIGVERALDLDSEGQLVASVLSKKSAAGSTHVVIDLPIGPTAKVRTRESATRLGQLILGVGRSIGLEVKIVETDGTQPVGGAIGPALEARAACAVLRGDADAPADLRERALVLAAELIALAKGEAPADSAKLARALLADGRAWRKFQAICAAQGGMREPPIARHLRPVLTERRGVVRAIDNRRLARVAKLAGAPQDPAAGVVLHAKVGAAVDAGAPLFTVHAESPGELEYALDYARSQSGIVQVEETS